MPLGFLAVFSETGPEVTLDEFQDWYNNEHVPLRLNRLSSILTGARFSAADSLKPTWLALYDVDNTSTFQDESYTRLRVNRSPREAALIKRLEILDRRTCRLIADSGVSSFTTSLASENPTKIIYTHGLSPESTITTPEEQDAAIMAWAEKTFGLLKGIDGWLRTRVFENIENLIVGLGIKEGPEGQKVSPYLVIHELSLELTSESIYENDTFRQVIRSTSDLSVKENRKWQLYRAYPGLAQGNLDLTSV
ncbi:hypothetical protein BDQ12DRAFT_610167 [Crucibulum laeve]|uniref:EthD domain-containing protein n=1 Tax=Crucibulum laeve TaxID=68775 RepID=A0A5C3LTI0_9AGAR|nr:hypothetical protein BDQ12DRAFT_610167 [Crucibulum laeve]